MFGVVRAFVNPARDESDFAGLEPPPFLRGRHTLGFVGLVQAGNDLALRRLARHDRDRTAGKFANGVITAIKPELAAAVGFVKAVTGEAVFREDRADFAVEVDGGFGRLGGLRRGCGQQEYFDQE